MVAVDDMCVSYARSPSVIASDSRHLVNGVFDESQLFSQRIIMAAPTIKALSDCDAMSRI
jgi:hypothetical protein